MGARIKAANKEFDIVFQDDAKTNGLVNGKKFNWDVSKLRNNIYQVIKEHHSYNVEVSEPAEGKTRIKVNGNIYEVERIDKFAELLKSLGMEKGGVGKVNVLKAPMPGLVIEVGVKIGDSLKKGDRVLVLEAMKMENVIKAPADVTVATIEVEKGKTVDKNQEMVRFT